jgi:hypothetical protein
LSDRLWLRNRSNADRVILYGPPVSPHGLDRVVVLVRGASWFDDIAVFVESIDLPFPGVESVVPVDVDVDVLLSVLVVVVLAFAAVFVALLAVAAQFRRASGHISIAFGLESYSSCSNAPRSDLLQQCQPRQVDQWRFPHQCYLSTFRKWKEQFDYCWYSF